MKRILVIGWDIDEVDIREQRNTAERIENIRPEIVMNVAVLQSIPSIVFRRSRYGD